MAKVTLTKDQLVYLKEFIESRGFIDPVVVVEILDHFACMVEDKMSADPKLILEDATHAAHQDFGIMGFRYMEANSVKGHKLKYWRTAKANMRRLFGNPLVVLLIAVAGVLFYYTYLSFYNVKWWIFRFTDMSMFVYLLALLFTVLAFLRVKKENYTERRGYQTKAHLSNSTNFFPFILLFSFPQPPAEHKHIEWWAVAYAIVMLFAFLQMILSYQTSTQLIKHYKRAQQLFFELN